MPYNADWGNTPAYKAHVEANGSGDDFTNANGYPKEPVNSIMWALMSISIGSITEKNISEVYARLKFFEVAFNNGVWGQRYIGVDPTNEALSVNWEDYTLTREMVEQVLHLSTNASTESRSVWVKKLVTYIQNDRYTKRAKELYFGKSMTPTKCINTALDGFKLEYEASVEVLSHAV
jgi:hypothetical protein